MSFVGTNLLHCSLSLSPHPDHPLSSVDTHTHFCPIPVPKLKALWLHDHHARLWGWWRSSKSGRGLRYLTSIYFQWVVYTSSKWTPSVGSEGLILTQGCPKGSSITASPWHRGRGIWRRNWGCTEGGTGDKQWIWERRGALPWEQGSERLQRLEGTSCSHSKGEWWGRRDAGVTTSSSAGCPSGSESGHVGSLFPIIVRAKGVYPVCLGSSSTGTLCRPAAPGWWASCPGHLRTCVPLRGIKK